MSDKYPGGFVTANAPAGFSVFFDGSGDYLTLNPGASFAFGTGDFTIEQWIYPTATINQAYLIDARNSGQTTNWAMGFGLNGGSGRLSFFDGATAYEQPTSTYNLNAWNHCVTVRSGTTLSIFLNGTRVYTTTNSTNLNVSPTLSYIARGYATGSELYFTGYFSNLRVVKGTAVYSPSSTTLVTPTQLLNISGTSLLTCNSPTIIDQSTNAYAITVNGDAKVSNFTPFAGYTGFNPALGAAAGGVWTIDEAAYYQNNRQWPIYDPYFKNTTLMLHGNGANAAQNNTFLDSSTNNFTITRNGNTTQGTFTPFSQTGWSTYFLRSNTDYLGLPNGSVATGSNDFSIEAFVYPLDRASSYAVFGGNSDRATGANSSITVTLTSTNGYIEFTGWFGGSPVNLYSPTIPINTWTHFVICRTGTTIGMFVNGVRVSTVACSGSINAGSSTYNPSIGSNGTGSADNFTGYISNFRMIIGSGVYSALNTSYTVPTSPLIATTNTKVLACQNNRYVDNSANNYTITPGGSPSVQAFSPFVPAYITPTTYSNWFDGSGDYLTLPANAAFNFNTGDFTLETWLYMPNFSAFQEIFSQGSGNFQGIGVYITTAGKVNLDLGNGSSWFASLLSASSLRLNSWTHLAIVRQSTTYTIYLNGASDATTTTATFPSDASGSISYIGIYGPLTSQPFIGCMSNFRIVKGTAVYTANFTPPTAPLTAITNTQLLTCQSSTFIDNSTNNFTITANGNAQPVTSPTPFPAKVDTTTLNSAYSTSLIGGSGYFDGSGDYLNLASNAAFGFGTGNFTVEFWMYPTSGITDKSIYHGTITDSLVINTDASGKFVVRQYGVADLFTSATALTVNAWNHIVVSRSGTTMSGWLNGSRTAGFTGSNSTNFATTALYIGCTDATLRPISGYISNLRVVKGTAVYDPTQTGFTPPTAPVTAISGTSLLLSATNAGIIDSTAKNVLETVGNAQISTTQSKWGGGSMLFDGSGDAVKAPYTPNMDFGTGDFTIECWVYTTNVSPGYSQTVLARHGSSGGTIWIVQILNGGTSRINLVGSVNCAGTTVAANTWTHLAFTRSGTSLRAFNNGVLITTVTDSTSLSGTQVLTVGAQSDAVESFIGYIDDVRITKGYARYTTNFTPPTSQLQDQ